MKFVYAFAMLILIDTAAYFSVPMEVRQENRWAVAPFVGGLMLGAAYHFGNRLRQCGDKSA